MGEEIKYDLTRLERHFVGWNYDENASHVAVIITVMIGSTNVSWRAISAKLSQLDVLIDGSRTSARLVMLSCVKRNEMFAVHGIACCCMDVIANKHADR